MPHPTCWLPGAPLSAQQLSQCLRPRARPTEAGREHTRPLLGHRSLCHGTLDLFKAELHLVLRQSARGWGSGWGSWTLRTRPCHPAIAHQRAGVAAADRRGKAAPCTRRPCKSRLRGGRGGKEDRIRNNSDSAGKPDTEMSCKPESCRLRIKADSLWKNQSQLTVPPALWEMTSDSPAWQGGGLAAQQPGRPPRAVSLLSVQGGTFLTPESGPRNK